MAPLPMTWFFLILVAVIAAVSFGAARASRGSRLGPVFALIGGMLAALLLLGFARAGGGLPVLFLVATVGGAFWLGKRAFRRPVATIPRSEIAALGSAITRADALAAGGHVGEGFSHLLQGLHAARDAHREGTPWAGELVVRWEEVVQDFAADHHLAPGSEVTPAASPEGAGTELASAARAELNRGDAETQSRT